MPTPFAADSACGVKSALSRTQRLARNHGLDRRGATNGCTIGDASPAIDEQRCRMARARRSLRDNTGPAPAQPVRGRCGERMTAEAAGVFRDYSKTRIDAAEVKLHVELADQSGLRERIDAMFRGEKINVTENRAVLHVALRAPRGASIVVDGKNVVPDVHAVLDKMATTVGIAAEDCEARALAQV